MTIQKMKSIIEVAEQRRVNDESLSDTIQIELKNETDTHVGNDDVEIRLKSNFAECVSTLIGH